MVKSTIYFSFIAFVFFISSCKKKKIVINTSPITEISATGAQSGGTISALTYTVSGLQMGGKAIITITPIGTGCYESSTKECIAKNCPSPSISTHPADVTLCSGKDTKFSASSSPSTGVKYQWQQDGVDVVDGGVYSGSSTNTLIISNVSGLDDKKYHLKILSSKDSIIFL